MMALNFAHNLFLENYSYKATPMRIFSGDVEREKSNKCWSYYSFLFWKPTHVAFWDYVNYYL